MARKNYCIQSFGPVEVFLDNGIPLAIRQPCDADPGFLDQALDWVGRFDPDFYAESTELPGATSFRIYCKTTSERSARIDAHP